MTLRKQTKVWETADGRRVRICDMDDQHLINTMNMLRRVGAKACAKQQLFFLTCRGPEGDGAQMAFEGEMDRAFDSDWSDYVPEVYWSMDLDFHRRDLDASLLKEYSADGWVCEQLLGGAP